MANQRKNWDRENQSSLPYIPENVKEFITEHKARSENVLIGQFAARYLQNSLQSFCSNRREQLENRAQKSQIIAMGYGQGFDSQWMMEAALAGLQVVWIDDSEVACKNATIGLAEQHKVISETEGLYDYPHPRIVKGDIATILENPNGYGLDLRRVKMWYQCRTFGNLTEQALELVLQKIGETLSIAANPKKVNAIVYINALKDHNPDFTATTSSLYRLETVCRYITSGAKCEIEAHSLKKHQYFNKCVAAVTFLASRTPTVD